MAKKDKTVVEEPKEPENDYGEIHETPMQVIGILTKEEENPVVEKAKEEPKEEPKVETPTPEVPKAPEIDTAKLTAEVTGAVKDTIKETLKGNTPDETKNNEDAYALFEKTIQDKEGRPPTYKEALEFVKLNVKAELKAEQAEEEKKAQDAQQAVKDSEKAKLDSFNAFITQEINELTDSGRLPRIKNANDPKDPGNVALMALYQAMTDINQKRVAEGKPVIVSINKIFHEYYKPPETEVPGADAPVSVGRSAPSPEPEPGEYDYNDIHGRGGKKSFLNGAMDLLRGKK